MPGVSFEETVVPEVRKRELALQDHPDGSPNVYKCDFWSEENRKYSKPHFGLEQAGRIVNKLAGGREYRLPDVGCGPAALRRVQPNIDSYRIEIAIQQPRPNLLEADLPETPVSFGGMRFEIVVALRFFENVGNCQEQKLAEMCDVLTADGKFVASYVNFGHRNPQYYWPYRTIRTQRDFRANLAGHFKIARCFPTSHNWRHTEPNHKFHAGQPDSDAGERAGDPSTAGGGILLHVLAAGSQRARIVRRRGHDRLRHQRADSVERYGW
jgi:hypothetical protein